MVQRSHLPGHRFELAVAVLRRLAQARQAGGGGLNAHQIAQALNIDPLQIEPVLDTLVGIAWVGRLDEPGAARHVLLCDLDRTPAQPLVASTLLNPSPSLTHFWQQARFDRMTLRELLGE